MEQNELNELSDTHLIPLIGWADHFQYNLLNSQPHIAIFHRLLALRSLWLNCHVLHARIDYQLDARFVQWCAPASSYKLDVYCVD